MQRGRIGWLLLISLLLTASCATPLEPTFKGISKFQLNGNQNGKDPGFALGLDVNNPNRFKISLLSYDLNITVSDKKVGEAHARKRQVMQANGSSTISFDVATNPKQLFDGMLGAIGAIFGKEKSVSVGVEGTITVRAKGIRRKILVNLQRDYAL